MSNLEVIKPEGEQPQPRTWKEDMEAHNADYSRPTDKRFINGHSIEHLQSLKHDQAGKR